MFIERVEPLNYGPFAIQQFLMVDRNVTVLTGPNDVGKTSLLRLLAKALASSPGKAEEDEVNADTRYDTKTHWEEDVDIGARLRVHLCEGDSLPMNTQVLGSKPTGFTVKASIAPKVINRIVTECLEGEKLIQSGQWPYQSPFRVVSLPTESELRNTVQCNDPTNNELNLFRHALGSEFTFQNLITLSPRLLEERLGCAETVLNRSLEQLFSSSRGLRWRFRSSSDRKEIHCYLTDPHGGFTPLGSRGAGVRKVMSVLASLLCNDFDKDYWLILFDEPESSLHADSQHLLRRLLEQLASKSNVQVIYATHSPSMINVLRPKSIRLLQRANRSDKPTSIIDNNPFKDSYLPVRASLGLTPADSLLYAPVTIIVEGDTEVLGVTSLMFRLANENVPGFEDVPLLLSQCHFLDGMGDRFSFICQLAKSQGAKPILLLDGDKKRHLAQHKIEEKHPDVPIVLLPDGQEFEELVPREVYFQAVAELVGDNSGKVTEENYNNWVANSNLAKQMVLTKRATRWLDFLGLPEPRKAAVMQLAFEKVDVGRVNTDPLLKLVGHIRALLS